MIVGSLRRHSFNHTLAEHIVTALGDKATVTFADIHDLPLMNQDIEFPAAAAVVRLRQQVQATDTLWLVSSEYNGTIPGGLKNVLDWLSRPTEADTFAWYINDRLAYQVTGVGKRLNDRQYMMIDNGGIAEPVTDRVFNVGLGLLTLLDGAKDGHPALVNLTGGTDYYNPQTGTPHPVSFVDDSGQDSSKLFGQGAELQVRSFTVFFR